MFSNLSLLDAANKLFTKQGITTPPSSLSIRCISAYILWRFVSLNSARASLRSLLNFSCFQYFSGGILHKKHGPIAKSLL
jgi:hypothetical protein